MIPSRSRGPLIVAGALAQRPFYGGHTWVLLQYLLGFRRLGWDVVFLDRLEPEMCVDASGERCKVERSVNLAYLMAVVESFGLEGRFSLRLPGGEARVGLDRRTVLERVREAPLLLDVMGYLDDEAILGAARRRVFLDIDPGFGQMWFEQGLHDPFAGYDAFVTIGENVGRPGCGVPDCGRAWVTTRPPVFLPLWPRVPPNGGRFTTVASWRGPFGPIDRGNRRFGLRVHEFRKFVGLPRAVRRGFEAALDIHPAEVDDIALLTRNGWILTDPRAAAGDPWTYRSYIRDSLAEFMVAKEMYVATGAGWFSDRSACYLASGRPVLAQDTGLAELYPVGEGLVLFSSLEEAIDGVERIAGDVARHAAAAREIAVEYFDSDKVLDRLVERLAA